MKTLGISNQENQEFVVGSSLEPPFSLVRTAQYAKTSDPGKTFLPCPPGNYFSLKCVVTEGWILFTNWCNSLTVPPCFPTKKLGSIAGKL